MDQPEEVLEKLERFNVQKNPEITRELDEYVSFVARTGESVFNWALVKRLYREKLINVITEFNEASANELPVYPNVDPFNYETMKKMLIERLDSFNAAPFTIQRISELLADPRKQYSRIDKFMRAVEKNILVVSTVSPGRTRSEESENGDSLDSVGLNGDFSSDVNVDIDMDNDNDGSFTMTKEFTATMHHKEGNHDIVTVTQESIVTKKIGTKEEESSAATVAVSSNGEPLQPTKTEITIESQSSVTITVCEPQPTEEFNPAAASTEEVEKSPTETTESTEQTTNNVDDDKGVIKATEPIISIVSEPKIDEDALLNEPLRPADDETLEDTSQTTPLAALENIVANRTVIEETPRIEEQEQQQKFEESVEQSTSDVQEQVDNTTTTTTTEENPNDTEDSETVAKRLKIDELAPASAETASEESAPEEQETDNVVISEVVEQQSEENLTENQQIDSSNSTNDSPPITETPSDEKSQTQTENVAATAASNETEEETPELMTSTQVDETVEQEVSAPVTDQSCTAAIDEEIIEQTEQQQQSLPPTTTEDEMEAAPIVENQMALDEDVCAPEAVESVSEASINAEMDVNLTPAVASSKMDTDNEAENAQMDVDDDEPMDQ